MVLCIWRALYYLFAGSQVAIMAFVELMNNGNDPPSHSKFDGNKNSSNSDLTCSANTLKQTCGISVAILLDQNWLRYL